MVAASDHVADGRKIVSLDALGSDPNVHIRVENVATAFRQNLSPRLLDFLEIASYVFSADCATPRGTKWTDDESKEPWERDLAFIIPVREPAFWKAPKLRRLIEEILTFLSNDKYSFTFVPLKRDRVDAQYFEFGDLKNWPFHSPERVLMFSGGLDSLAGAIETAAGGGRLVLVSHRPVSTLDSRQRKLFSELQKKYPGQLIRVPVWINKNGSLGREPTQRTRSFLFAALGTLVAESLQAGGVRFYENGIVSLNLPLAQEALRARASRTTHPMGLHLLSTLCAAVTGREFVVDNPYLFKTKTEVVESLVTHEATHLIALTCSCSHSMFQTKTQRHCGCCSQCIDRRFATTAAGLQTYDSQKDYVVDVFVGPRKEPSDRAIAADYALHGIELARRSENELAAIFNSELGRAVQHQAKRSEAAQKIISMHKRHGLVVSSVLEDKLRENAAKVVDGTLDNTSLLAMVVVQPHRLRQPQVLAEQLGEGIAGASSSSQSPPSPSPDLSVLARVEESIRELHTKFDAATAERKIGRRKITRKPDKRDTIIFAAIVKDLKGMRYCSFLHSHGIKPKWSDSGPGSYQTGYQKGNPWRKKVQDEKTRARQRMDRWVDSELANAFAFYLRDEFEELSPLLHSRNSRHASKNSTHPSPA